MQFDTRDLRPHTELSGKTFLICIGAAKCATSWIFHYLADLPDVTVSPLKELHFFNAKFPSLSLGDMDAFAMKRVGFHLDRDGDMVENLCFSEDFQASVDRMQMIYDDNAYFGHFARLCTPETRLFCDVTPGYSVIGLEGFDYMKTFCASQDITVKILYIMRDPVDRLWSQLRHLQEINPDKPAADKWADAIQSDHICARADYAGTVSDLTTTFASDDILYLFYEDLFSETSLRQLCDFAGVDYRPGNTAERRNRTQVEIDLPDAAREAILDLLGPQYTFCRDRFGARVPNSWIE